MKNLRHLFQILFCLYISMSWVISQQITHNGVNYDGNNSIDFISSASHLTEQSDIEKSKVFMANSKTRFEENKGQVLGEDAHKVNYFFNSKGMTVFLLNTGITYQFNKTHYPDEDKVKIPLEREKFDLSAKKNRLETYRIDVVLKGANPSPNITTERKSDDFTQYYNRNVLNIHNYGKIIYHNVYPNIDWVIYTKGENLKYDFIVHPGGNPNDIVLETKWVENLKLNPNGDLVLKTRMGEITEERPISYQENKEVKTSFILTENEIQFKIQNYDPTKELIIDPLVRLWGTYYGDSGYDVGFSCAVDGSQNVYLAGGTKSNTQIASGGYQNVLVGEQDCFVVKFNTNGVRQWATYYGGENIESSACMVVDVAGNVYIAGGTNSTSGIASGGHQNTFAGGSSDSFLVKFNTNGVRQWATYYGGPDMDPGIQCAVDNSGNVYLSGLTYSTSGIASGGHQNTFNGGDFDAYLVKFNASGVRQWGTYYGGPGMEQRSGCSVDGSGNVYLSGETDSNTGIAIGGHQNTRNGLSDSYLVKFNSSGVRQWGTYYGGTGFDYGESCAVDVSGNVYLAGFTFSTTSIASGGHQNTFGGGSDTDAFLVKFNSNGIRQWGTYYGGNDMDRAINCKTDVNGNIYMSGFTLSTSSIASGGYQNNLGGNFDAFLVSFNSAGVRQWGTYYGGLDYEHGYSCAIDDCSNIYLAGITSSNAAIANGGHQNTYAGSNDGYLVKFATAVDTNTTTTTAICENEIKPLTSSGIGNGTWSIVSGNGAIIVGPAYQSNDISSSTPVTIKYTDICGNETDVTFIVHPIPSAGTLSGIQTICAGSTTTFNSTEAGGSWSTSDPNVATVDTITGVITGVGAGTATITYNVIGAGSCPNDSATRTVTIIGSSSAGTLSGAQNICIGSTTTFTSTQSGGTWSTSDAGIATVDATTGVITGVSAGTATITYTVIGTGGCPDAIATRTVTVFDSPSAGTLSGTQIICIGSTSTFSSTQGGGTWSTSDSGIATVDVTTGIITGISAGTATITYTAASGSCPDGTAIRTITVTAPPFAGTLSGTQNICIGSSTTFNSTEPGGSWSTSNAGIATVVATTGQVTGVSAGTATITYTVMGSGGCPDAIATRTVTITTPPSAGTLSGIQNICIGSTTTFSSTQGGGTWSTSNAGIATINTSTGVLTGVSAGTAIITYTVVSSGSCPDGTATRTITVTPPPSAGTLSGTQNICIGSTTTFNSTEPGGSWSTSNAGIATVDVTTGEVTGVSAGTATITYTVMGTGGCPDATETRTVTVTTPPSAGTLSGTQNICIGSITTFSSTESGGIWSTSDASIVTVNSSNGEVTGVGPGTAIITYTVTGTCSATNQMTIEVYPPLVMSISNDTTICSNATILISTGVSGGTGNYTLTWDNSLPPLYNQSVTPTSTTVYTATIDDGCTVIQKTVTVTIEQVPSPNFSADVLTGCVPFNVELTNLSLPGSVQCEWTIDNGFYTDDCTNINTLISEPGCYDITLKLTSQSGCTDSITYTDYICGEASPTAAFLANPTSVSTIDPEVKFTNLSSGATNYDWSFGDGTLNSQEFEPTHTFPDQSSGTYVTTLIVTTDFGCSDTARVIIEVKEDLIFYVPNSFTPDASGINDLWKPVFYSGFDPMSLNLSIFNRWGELIWESHNANVGWDGTYGGRIVQAGTYTWKMDFKEVDNAKHKSYQGHINLLK